jgi:tetratricopeptide (TPR) repeat protein
MKKIAYILTLIFLSSCSGEFLELYPETSLNEGNFYQSEGEFILLANGCYVPLRNYEKETHWIIAELISDNAAMQHTTRSGEPTKGIVDQFLTNANNVAYADFWNGSYQGITRCNKLLTELDRTSVAWSKPGIAQRTAGEALFLRALYYFNLVRQFGGVPLVTTPVGSKEAVDVKRADEATVYEQIIQDLTQAATLLDQARDVSENGRANVGAAQALLGKVYLTLKDYNKAAQSFKAVIDLDQYVLLTNYADLFNPVNKDFRETIFAVQYSESTAELSNRFIFWHAPITSGGAVTLRPSININNAGSIRPTQDLVNAFEAGDKRKAASIAFWRGEDWDAQIRDIPYCNKFKPPVSAPNDRAGDNLPIIRYSDVLLSYAEALNGLGQTAQAIPFVQQVRDRAGLSTPIPAAGQSALSLLIEKERQVEFCFENQRWYDLNRTGRALVVLAEHGQREKQQKSYLYETAFEMTPYKLLGPVPSEQVLINKLKQNPGY